MGNDIVDLLSPYVRAKTTDKKFVGRVLTTEERIEVLSSRNPDVMLQVFWAAKEAAFKAIQRSNPAVSSAPRRYRFVFQSAEEGLQNKLHEIKGYVKTPDEVVYIWGYRHKNFIHCIGTTGRRAQKSVFWAVEQVSGRFSTDLCRSPAVASVLVRRLAQKKIAAALSITPDEIQIFKSVYQDRLLFPEIYINFQKTDMNISFSHDGRFVAFAYIKDET